MRRVFQVPPEKALHIIFDAIESGATDTESVPDRRPGPGENKMQTETTTNRYEIAKSLIGEWRNCTVPVTVSALDQDGFDADEVTASIVLRAFFAQLDDAAINKTYEEQMSQGLGESVGEDGDTPREAAEREGWHVMRTWDTRATKIECVVAQDCLGRIWAIEYADDGPWAIMLAG